MTDTKTIEEEWRDIPGFDGIYQISNFGRVKSLKRYCLCHGGAMRLVRERILKQNLRQQKRRSPTIEVSLSTGKTNKGSHAVLNLLAKSFEIEKRSGEFYYHKDGDILNNQISNIAIGGMRNVKNIFFAKQKRLDKYPAK